MIAFADAYWVILLFLMVYGVEVTLGMFYGLKREVGA